MLARAIADQLGRRLDARNLYLLHRMQGGSIGTVVTATAFMRGVHAATGRRFVVVSNHPDVFRHNPLVELNYGMRDFGPIAKPVVKAVLRHAVHPAIGAYDHHPAARMQSADVDGFARRRPEVSETEYCSGTLAQRWHPGIDYARLVPEICFGEDEARQFAAKLALPDDYWVVKPVGIVSHTPNKEWGAERYAGVVSRLGGVTWVQVGTVDEPLLDGVIDLRGRTSLRELFHVVRGARGVLAGEGLLNHVAAAFNVRSFVVYSGYSHVGIARYANTLPIVRTPQVDCAPCWLRTPCPVPGKPCTSGIAVDQVVAALRPHVAGDRMPPPAPDGAA